MKETESSIPNKETADESKNGNITFSQWMDIGFAGILAGLSLYLFLAAPVLIGEVVLEPEEIPPIFFPRVVLMVIFSLSVGVIVRVILGKTVIEVDLAWKGVLRMAVMFAGMFIYILLFKRLGFILCTALLILFQSWYYGERNWIKLLVLTVVFPPIIYILFLQIFHIYLPRGVF